jgi:NAD(P)-dependent dehydrogenase (short-subunit alcohol dehydrogenase family)
MAIYEGWTFAAARGASRRTLHEIAEAVKTGPAGLEKLERARDIDLTDSSVDVALVEQVLETYARLGFHIWPRSFWRAACLKRVQ